MLRYAGRISYILLQKGSRPKCRILTCATAVMKMSNYLDESFSDGANETVFASHVGLRSMQNAYLFLDLYVGIFILCTFRL